MAGTTERDIARIEIRWALWMGGIVLLILGLIVITSVSMGINPPSNNELVDPKSLHRSGEFTEANLGTQIDPNGRVVARIIATQFNFVPACVKLPANRPVTLRFATPDVVHGITVTGTNVNTMIVPGYVSQVHTVFRTTGRLLMPCHEYCGLGHSAMIGRVQVVPPEQFKVDAQGRATCD
jgi:cytochrome c oxidase subunit 2